MSVVELLLLGSSRGSRGLRRLRGRYLASLLSHFDFLLHLTAVADELGRRSEFAQAVTHHVFSNEDCDMVLAVVNAEGESDHLGSDLTGSRPRLNHAGFKRLLALNLLQDARIDIWAFAG